MPRESFRIIEVVDGRSLACWWPNYCKLLITGCASGAAESRRAPSKSRRQTASLDFRAPHQILVFIAFSAANRLSRRTRLRLDRHAKDSDLQMPHSWEPAWPGSGSLVCVGGAHLKHYLLWQQLSCILSAVTTGWQTALFNACLEFAISQTCADSVAHECRSPPSDDSACRCLNAKTQRNRANSQSTHLQSTYLWVHEAWRFAARIGAIRANRFARVDWRENNRRRPHVYFSHHSFCKFKRERSENVFGEVWFLLALDGPSRTVAMLSVCRCPLCTEFCSYYVPTCFCKRTGYKPTGPAFSETKKLFS